MQFDRDQALAYLSGAVDPAPLLAEAQRKDTETATARTALQAGNRT